jgi:hypothetical protein
VDDQGGYEDFRLFVIRYYDTPIVYGAGRSCAAVRLPLYVVILRRPPAAGSQTGRTCGEQASSVDVQTGSKPASSPERCNLNECSI